MLVAAWRFSEDGAGDRLASGRHKARAGVSHHVVPSDDAVRTRQSTGAVSGAIYTMRTERRPFHAPLTQLTCPATRSS